MVCSLLSLSMNTIITSLSTFDIFSLLPGALHHAVDAQLHDMTVVHV